MLLCFSSDSLVTPGQRRKGAKPEHRVRSGKPCFARPFSGPQGEGKVTLILSRACPVPSGQRKRSVWSKGLPFPFALLFFLSPLGVAQHEKHALSCVLSILAPWGCSYASLPRCPCSCKAPVTLGVNGLRDWLCKARPVPVLLCPLGCFAALWYASLSKGHSPSVVPWTPATAPTTRTAKHTEQQRPKEYAPLKARVLRTLRSLGHSQENCTTPGLCTLHRGATQSPLLFALPLVGGLVAAHFFVYSCPAHPIPSGIGKPTNSTKHNTALGYKSLLGTNVLLV